MTAQATPSLDATWNEAIERCAEEARAQWREFLSPEYATDQPLSSLNERFACAQVERRILALKRTLVSGNP